MKINQSYLLTNTKNKFKTLTFAANLKKTRIQSLVHVQ